MRLPMLLTPLLGSALAIVAAALPQAADTSSDRRSCGMIFNGLGPNFLLQNRGKKTCTHMDLYDHHVSALSYWVVDFCTCSFFYDSKGCRFPYFSDVTKGPSRGLFNNGKVGYYYCWDHTKE
ncbi:hypothetical protein BU26DRAFT_598800 [Trematosphaeria pertusa]|uniref:Uncharacterized protein n=1 Tax=Trematosphaeria pertusa TaxID=390896 RepID=A0A6A6IZW6_9PLEO|nr:uncharacterized protein BU26DRAFT_598800 [Trematosphaeria pertusa]KAF2256004.1 hypothetical protein BU26DRAFT_598800 [Trematosphaeria pertusa]